MSLEDLVARAFAEEAEDMTAMPDVDALVARGMRARRRRLAIVTSIVATVVMGAIVVSPVVRSTAEPSPVAEPAAPTLSSYPRPRAGPGRGTSYFLGTRPDVDVTFTMPAGWEVNGVWVERSGSDPDITLAFVDVANIYTDGCRWQLVDPKPGPSVDDLVSAYAKVRGSQTAEDVTIDGYAGKQIHLTVPDCKPKDCKEGKFGFMQHDNDFRLGDEPTIGRLAPGGRYTVQILDVDGTRLVILEDEPPNTSAQDRIDMNAIVSSIDIG